MPLVSICIPCFNQTEHLRKTLDSIAYQTYSDFEVIISDDSTNDMVFKLINAHHLDKNKIKYFKNVPSLGTPSNWNYAIEKANGDLIKIMHHDDYFTSPDSLKKMAGMLDETSNSDFAFCGTRILDLKKKYERIHYANEKNLKLIRKLPEYLFLGNIIGSPSATIFRKKIYQPFNSKFKWVVDFDLYIRILRKKNKFNSTNEVLVCTVMDSHNVTNFCENNPDIDLAEHLQLFCELIRENFTLQFRWLFIKFFLELFAKYGITKIKLLRDTGFSESLPLNLYLLICITWVRFFRLKILNKTPRIVYKYDIEKKS